MDRWKIAYKGIKYKRSVFVTLLVSYLIIFLIPVIIGSVVYVRIEQIMIENAYRSNSALLEQTKHIMNSQTQEIDYLVKQIATSPKQQLLMQEGHTPSSTKVQYQFIEFMKELSRYVPYNASLYDFYVYFANSDTILSPTMKTNSSTFYNKIYTYGDMSYEEYKNNLLLSYHYNSYLPTQIEINNLKQESIVTYAHTLPIGEPNNIQGSLIILINEQQFHNVLKGVEGLHDGTIYILNRDKDVIMGQKDGRSWSESYKQRLNEQEGEFLIQKDGEEQFVAYTTSEANGWTYVSVFPKKVVLMQVNTVKKLTLITVFACLIMGILICIYMTRKQYSPIQDVVHMIHRGRSDIEVNKHNELKFIKDTVESLFGTEHQLKDKLSQQIPIIRTEFLSRLVRGQVDTNSITKEDLDFMGVTLVHEWFAVVIVDIDEVSEFMKEDTEREWALIRFILTNLSNDMLDKSGYVLELEKSRLVILINLDEAADGLDTRIETFIQQLMDVMKERFTTWITVGVSARHAGLNTIVECYDEAIVAISYKMIKGSDSILYYDEVRNLETKSYHYPMDLESQLTNYTKNGDRDNTERLLDKIYQINFTPVPLSPDMSHWLFLDLQSTLLKILNTLRMDYKDFFPGDSDPMKYMVEAATALQMFEGIKVKYAEVCGLIKEDRTDHNETIYKRMTDFIESHYHDNNLGLTMIADHLGLNSIYVSAFFKKYSGENMTDFITRIRVQHTKQMLTEDMTINDIALRVGYSNNIVLTKVFKKLEGVTPGKFREQLRNNQINADDY